MNNDVKNGLNELNKFKRKKAPKKLKYLEDEGLFPPLATITRPTVDTAAAAYYLNRKPQTLRIWSMDDQQAPIKPIKIQGRLAWPVAELRRILGVP
jgi:hypothetical protein